MYYILFYKTVENYIEKRVPYREEHLAMVNQEYENGTLLMAGPFAEPVDGAVLIFRTESYKPVEEFALNDPYVKNGLITEWNIRQWNVVVGGE
jgi:uncharacterized protein